MLFDYRFDNGEPQAGPLSLSDPEELLEDPGLVG
jgi:hypothetical protein